MKQVISQSPIFTLCLADQMTPPLPLSAILCLSLCSCSISLTSAHSAKMLGAAGRSLVKSAYQACLCNFKIFTVNTCKFCIVGQSSFYLFWFAKWLWPPISFHYYLIVIFPAYCDSWHCPLFRRQLCRRRPKMWPRQYQPSPLHVSRITS